MLLRPRTDPSTPPSPTGRRRHPRSVAAMAIVASMVGVAFATVFAATALGASHTVRIVDTGVYDSAFSPSTIRIQVGDKITWSNQSMNVHNVVFASFGSSDLGTGQTYTHRFQSAGTFRYTCTIHGFRGTVVVTGAAATPKPTPRPTPKPTPKPMAKPTPKPTARPQATAKASPSPAIAIPSSSPSPSSSPTSTAVPGTSPALGVTSGSSAPPSDAPPTSPAAADGPPIGILAALVAAGLIALGVVAARSRRSRG